MGEIAKVLGASPAGVDYEALTLTFIEELAYSAKLESDQVEEVMEDMRGSDGRNY